MMQANLKGPWNDTEVREYLIDSDIPMRLSCIGADGFPRVISVWFNYREDRIYCVSHQDSSLIRLLQRSEKVGFEVAPNIPPYQGVRGQGIARLLVDKSAEPDLTNLLARYTGGSGNKLSNWLLDRVNEEVLIEIEPLRLFSWDYRERMKDI
jgi:nitroimidazol reductase NimA-like FMN-containing flavoprotein (pyridoxamine 5'-phosphate oxidase superfamily)